MTMYNLTSNYFFNMSKVKLGWNFEKLMELLFKVSKKTGHKIQGKI